MNNSINVQKNNLSILIIIMISSAVFALLPTDIYAPSLPLIPKLFKTTFAEAQLTISIFLLGFAVTQFLAGMISDSHGRKPVFITGLVLFIIGTFICIFSTSIQALLAGRFIEGIGGGAVAVLSRIILRDAFTGIKMAQVGSYVGAVVGLSPGIAPVIGGFLQEKFGFDSVFIFLLCFAFMMLYLVIFHLSETNQFKHLHTLSFKEAIEKYKQVLSNKIFWGNVIATGCGLAVIITCSVINPFILQNILKLSPYQYGQYALIAMSGMFVGIIFNGMLVSKFGLKRMMVSGMILITANGAALCIFHLLNTLSIATIIIPTFLMVLGAAFILPNAIVGAFSPFQKIAGTAGAVYGFLQILITSIASAIISLFSQPSQLLLGLMTGSLMIFSILSYCFLDTK